MSGAVQKNLILILLKLGMRKGFLPYIEISFLGIAFKLNLNLVDPIITGMATVWTFITLDSSSVPKDSPLKRKVKEAYYGCPLEVIPT